MNIQGKLHLRTGEVVDVELPDPDQMDVEVVVWCGRTFVFSDASKYPARSYTETTPWHAPCDQPDGDDAA